MCVIDRTFRFVAAAIVAAFVLAGVSMSAANAQQSTPAQLVLNNPNGGQALINAAQQLIITDHSTLKAFLGLVPGANEQVKVAIATAIGQALKIIALTDPAGAVDMQTQAAAITDRSFILALAAAKGDVQLGAVGGAQGGAAGAGLGGPGGGVGGGGVESFQNRTTGSPVFAFTGGTGGSGGTTYSPTTTTTTSETQSTSGSGLQKIPFVFPQFD
jgi:hypothetical protein